MTGDWQGRLAVITGGASGIGRALAEAMLALDMQVVICDIEGDRVKQVANEIGAIGMQVDVSDEAQMAQLAQDIVAKFGAVHVLCNNAGVGPMAAIKELNMGDWNWMLDVNLKGVIHGITHFLPILKANADGAHILNTGSMASLMPVPSLGTYCTAKYGVLGLSEVLSMELENEGVNVDVTVLCPGPVSTNIPTSTRNRPADGQGGLRDVVLEDSIQYEEQIVDWISPADAAAIAIAAMKRGDFLALTHPARREEVRARHARIEQAFDEEIARRSAVSAR